MSYGNLTHPPELALGVYFHQCSIAMSCADLARATLFLARHGVRNDGAYVHTSLTREDSGAGACEILLVQRVEIR